MTSPKPTGKFSADGSRMYRLTIALSPAATDRKPSCLPPILKPSLRSGRGHQPGCAWRQQDWECRAGPTLSTMRGWRQRYRSEGPGLV